MYGLDYNKSKNIIVVDQMINQSNYGKEMMDP